MSNVFLTGCTHFGHENIIRMAARPFANAEEMDHQMVMRWNARVSPRDEVYHLGDFAMRARDERVEEIFNSLNGRMHLIHGNHDKPGVKTHSRWLSSQSYLWDHRLGPKGMVLFHYPIEEWEGWWHDSWHVHAHTHQSRRQGAIAMRRRVNVSVEAWDYAPAPLDEVLKTWN